MQSTLQEVLGEARQNPFDVDLSGGRAPPRLDQLFTPLSRRTPIADEGEKKGQYMVPDDEDQYNSRGSGLPNTYSRKKKWTHGKYNQAKPKKSKVPQLDFEAYWNSKKVPEGLESRLPGYDQNSPQAQLRQREYQHLMEEELGFFNAYMQSRGRSGTPIVGVGTAQLGPTTGAVYASDGLKGKIAFSEQYEVFAEQFAKHYLPGVPEAKATELAKKYMVMHELSHSYQRGMGFDDPKLAELDNERTLQRYFTDMATMYEQAGDAEKASEYTALAGIAEARTGQLNANYGGNPLASAGGEYSSNGETGSSSKGGYSSSSSGSSSGSYSSGGSGSSSSN